MISLFLLSTFFFLPAQPPADPQQSQIQTGGLAVRDSVVIRKVLKAVKTHILSVTKERRRPLVIKEGRKSRRFIVVDFLTPVFKDKGIYTAQVDADEYDHKIPRILYVDVRVAKGIYKVSRVRIGPNHFRDNVAPQ